MARGKDAIVALAKGTTWGTAVSVNASNAGLLCTDINAFIEIPDPLPDESAGYTYLEYVDAGNRKVEPVLSGWLRWANEHWKLLCQLIGDDAVTGAGPYVHTMDVQAEQQLFSTLCYYDGVTVREIPSFMPNRFTLSGEGGQMWRFEMGGIGNRCLLSGQTNSSLGSVTYRTKEKRIPFGASQVRINNQSAGALGSSDIIYPAQMSIAFTRAIGGEFVARAVAEGSGEWQSNQPEEGGLIVCEITMRFNEYTETGFPLDLLDEDFKKLDLTLTGPAISGGNYGLVMSFPALRVLNTDLNTSGPDRIPQTITLRACKAQAAPTGMTGIQNLFRLVFTDDVSTAYDA